MKITASRVTAIAAVVLLIIVVGAGIFYPLVLSQVSADGSRSSQLQSPSGDPKAPYPGIYIFLDGNHVDPAQYPLVTGGNMTFVWNEIELADNYFDWWDIDHWLETETALGKPAGMGFSLYDGRCCGGQRTPRWLMWEDEETVVRCDALNWPIPRYWNPRFLAEYNDYINAFAARYDGDPRIAWIELGTGIFGENKAADTADWQCLLDAGLTEDVWIQTSMQIMDTFAEAFRETPLLFQFAPVYNPETLSIRQRKTLTDFAASKGIGLKHNGLQEDIETAIIDDPGKSYYKAGHWDPFFSWWEEVPVAFETYGTQFCGSKQNSEYNVHETLWCMYSGLNKHPDYLVLSKDMITDPLRQDALAFADHYLGVELHETDSVWVALRETEQAWFPQHGNYDFWLIQNDAVPGGLTVPEWNVSEAPEGRFARRTDIGTGNPDMYFDVEDGWLYQNQGIDVTVEIIYYDDAAGAWSMAYDAVGEVSRTTETVQKNGSGQWLTHTFEVADAYFGNRLPGGGGHAGSDFLLRSTGSDTFFNRVRVLRDDVAPTPTPLAPVAPAPTATPGPGEPQPPPPPRQMLLREGVSGYWGVEDTWIGAWCLRDGSDDGTIPHGNLQYLGMRVSGADGEPANNDVCNALLRFDVSRIPWGSEIAHARLILKPIDQSNVARLYFNLYDMNKSWHEHQATWYQARNGLPWHIPGADGAGDHPDLPLDFGIMSGDAASSSWTSAEIAPLVQRWIDDPASNRGVLLRSYANRVGYELASSEHPQLSWRPALEISYYLTGETPDTPTPTPTTPPTQTPTPTATATPSTGAVEGWVFHDENGDGNYSNEPGIVGVELQLLSLEESLLLEQYTDASGYFRFDDLPPAQYVLSEEVPSGWLEPQPGGSSRNIAVVANQVQPVHLPIVRR